MIISYSTKTIMKTLRYSLILFVLFVFSFGVASATRYYSPLIIMKKHDRGGGISLVASGTVTAANTQLSLVDGTAFAYFSGVDLSAYQTGKHLLAVYNQSTGALIGMGYCSATAPAGETLDVNFAFLASLDLTSGWGVDGTCTINDINTFTNVVPGGYVYKITVLSIGGLYKSSLSASATFGTPTIISNGAVITYASNGESNIYKIASYDGIFIYNNSIVGAVTDINSASMQQVLDPPSTGVRIVSAKSGATQNWASKGSGAVNAAVTYKIWSVGN